eukprot:scaffold37046_cov72-Phaeocystis_antarctica.AAC.6
MVATVGLTNLNYTADSDSDVVPDSDSSGLTRMQSEVGLVQARGGGGVGVVARPGGGCMVAGHALVMCVALGGGSGEHETTLIKTNHSGEKTEASPTACATHLRRQHALQTATTARSKSVHGGGSPGPFLHSSRTRPTATTAYITTCCIDGLWELDLVGVVVRRATPCRAEVVLPARPSLLASLHQAVDHLPHCVGGIAEGEQLPLQPG